MKRLVQAHVDMVTEAGLNQQSPQFVFHVLLTELTALAATVPSLPLPKNSNNPRRCTACFRTRRYDIMSMPINPKPQARKPPGRLLESRKKRNQNCYLCHMCHTSDAIGIKNECSETTLFFLQNILPTSEKSHQKWARPGSWQWEGRKHFCVISLCPRD